MTDNCRDVGRIFEHYNVKRNGYLEYEELLELLEDLELQL